MLSCINKINKESVSAFRAVQKQITLHLFHFEIELKQNNMEIVLPPYLQFVYWHINTKKVICGLVSSKYFIGFLPTQNYNK